jgi:ribonuclease E
MKKEMLINVLQPEECRIAILEDGVLEELYVERTSHESYVGNIYKGRIVNIEPSIQAAFVDFGVGRNGFLHVSDVEPAYYRHLEQGRDFARRPNGRDRFRATDTRRREQPPPEREDADDRTLDEIADTPTRAEQMREPERAEPPMPPTEGEAAADEQEGKDRRRGRGRGRGRGRRGRGRDRRDNDVATPEQGAATEEAVTHASIEERPERAEAAGEAPAAPEEPRERFMDSAERRTEEEEGGSAGTPSSSFGDDDLFFPRSEPESAPSQATVHTPAPVREPEPEPEPMHSEAVADEEPTFAAEGDMPAFDEPAFEEAHDEELMDDEPGEESARESAEEDEDFDFGPPRRQRRDSRGDRGRDREPRGGPRRGGRPGMGRPGMGRPKPLIQDIFKRGQEVLVQVIKEGIGTKGPTLSTYISIAGRYLVLMPGLNRIGVSRKIEDDEQRRRLRDILGELQPPKGLGFIIRTAGIDRTKKELQNDLAYLTRLWQVVVRRIRKLKAPAEIYQESDMITRTIRDTFTNEIDSIWVDEPNAFAHAQEFMQIVMPRYASRIKLYEGKEPMFHRYGIEDEIARIQMRHVPLPAGGSIVIDQTEALVAIDVNSGNFRADNNAEETAYQMNLQAAKEIARQLRLRDLGGVIVNDFIDMRDEKHRRGVERALREAVRRDRARTKILRISQFGLIEMTRQRIRPSLKRSVYMDCPHCRSTGQVKTVESMSIDVMRMLQLAAHRDGVRRIQIRVADAVANYLLNKKRKEISRLEEGGNILVQVTGELAAAPELLEFVCYDNNDNEVKFAAYDENRRGRR